MGERWGVFFLVVVAALWGLTFPLIENSVQVQDPFIFVSLRFTLAALFLLPHFFKTFSRKMLIAGIFLGIINCGAYLTQTIGMQTISASRAAFITGTNALFVPLIAPLFLLPKATFFDIVSALVCCAGLYVLTGSDISKLSAGDLWVILCAFSVALSIAYTAYLANRNFDPMTITCSQIVITAIFSWLLSCFFAEFEVESLKSTSVLVSLLYCSLFATIVALALQTKYQKYVSAPKTALIFCLEPVFAAFFDRLINQSTLELPTIIGGGLILMSLVLSTGLNQLKSRLAA